jgi:hypothetical protein
MTIDVQVMEAFDARADRRNERREFFKTALNVGGFVVAGAAASGIVASSAEAQTAITPNDVLNFALNLEYLEAQFYSYAAFGVGLDESLLTGTRGTRGQVQIGTGAGMARRVPFADPVVAAYAREIAADEIAHVRFLRQVLSTDAVAQPTINISAAPGGAFAAAAAAAGVPNFDPYGSDLGFLYGAFLFEDAGVTAYKGAANALINNKVFLENAAGILAVEAYHAAIVRTALYVRGSSVAGDPGFGTTNSIYANVQRLSDVRDAVDGASDLDQGIAPMTRTGPTGPVLASNIFPADDANGAVAFSRTTGQVLNIVYLTRSAATMGGFFPNGVNGVINASAAN